MLLTLDIGNTNIKSVLFEDNNLIDFYIHSNENSIVSYLKHKKFSEAAICSVNPAKEKIIIKEISQKGISIFKVGIKNRFNIKINYKTPETLGMDRICSAAGAYDLSLRKKLLSENQFVLIIDFGTATTINVVTSGGNFIGGLIAPGIKTMLKSLNEQTAQLPFPDSLQFENLIGDSTTSSIISGVFTATYGMINEAVNYLMRKSNGLQPIIFITGGNANLIMPHLIHQVDFDEALVLKGLKIIYDLNK